MVKETLEARGIKAMLTRKSDIEIGLRERVLIANRSKADLFLSLHLNSTEKPGPQGHATFFLARRHPTKPRGSSSHLRMMKPSRLARKVTQRPKGQL